MSAVAAISTPPSEGGIAVIRISGENAIDIASKVFATASGKPVSDMCGYTCAYGKVFEDDRIIDDGVLTVFRSPKSYTGENIAEISCHGGTYIARKVLNLVIKNGAEPAPAGEFTKRAFLNGKLSLTEAEAVMDVISSNGEQSLRAANAAKDGALFKKISSFSKRLIKILGELSAWVDYPEEDLPELDGGALESSLDEIIIGLEKLIKSYDDGRVLRDGIDTVLVGRANVGKSTLMNLLLGYERSIVTDVEGTTRDIVEESVRLGDVVLRLSDTAGIRETDDKVESIGVSRSLKKLGEADLVLAVFDSSSPLTDEDKSLIENVLGKRTLAVLNKTDMPSELEVDLIREKLGEPVFISAKTSEGENELCSRITSMFLSGELDVSAGILANERQKSCTVRAYNSLLEARDALSIGQTFDAITVLIDEAESALLELTGEKITEAVVDEVFSKFCVGK